MIPTINLPPPLPTLKPVDQAIPFNTEILPVEAIPTIQTPQLIEPDIMPVTVSQPPEPRRSSRISIPNPKYLSLAEKVEHDKYSAVIPLVDQRREGEFGIEYFSNIHNYAFNAPVLIPIPSLKAKPLTYHKASKTQPEQKLIAATAHELDRIINKFKTAKQIKKTLILCL
jgi:hypothetical protein